LCYRTVIETGIPGEKQGTGEGDPTLPSEYDEFGTGQMVV
jgi:hypothetical protein